MANQKAFTEPDCPLWLCGLVNSLINQHDLYKTKHNNGKIKQLDVFGVNGIKVCHDRANTLGILIYMNIKNTDYIHNLAFSVQSNAVQR